MNLTYPERLALIDLTKVRLAKMRLYVVPARPCNNNRSLDNLNRDTDKHNPCLRLVDKVGASRSVRRASLLEITNRSQRIYQDWK
jgi:hypothetical protein